MVKLRKGSILLPHYQKVWLATNCSSGCRCRSQEKVRAHSSLRAPQLRAPAAGPWSVGTGAKHSALREDLDATCYNNIVDFVLKQIAQINSVLLLNVYVCDMIKICSGLLRPQYRPGKVPRCSGPKFVKHVWGWNKMFAIWCMDSGLDTSAPRPRSVCTASLSWCGPHLARTIL